MRAAERIASFVGELGYEAVPTDVVAAAKLHFLDALGCGLAASAEEVGTQTRRVALDMGGTPEATVIGASPRLPAASAALANGTLCHALDFDDTHGASICHISAVMAPTALACSEATRAAGKDMLAAYVCGCEVTTRLGISAAGAFHKRGLHPTSICGVFGAAAVAARLLDLGAAETTNALGIVGSMASGLFEYLSDGSMTKPIHAGWAAHCGIMAARLAECGSTGPASVLEGRSGLFSAFLGGVPSELADRIAELGESWETLRIAIKAYPACHFMHGCLGATADLIRQHGPSAKSVESIVVTVPEGAVAIVLEPREAKTSPRTAYDARFSLPYSIAAMITHGSIDVSSYRDESIREPDVLDLARKVRYEVKEYPTYPGTFPGGAVIRLDDGTELSAEHQYERGAPENPLTSDDVREKFRANARGALGEAGAEAVEGVVLRVEEQADLGRLGLLLSGVDVDE